MRHPLSVLALAVTATAAGASYNIDFGTPESTPPDTYAAAGEAGAWNTFGVLPSGTRFDLVDTDGTPTGARIYDIGGTQLLATDDPATSGDDEALMDEMFIGFNDPVDVCLWVEGLENGVYEVITYAMTPGDPDHTNRVRVDDGTPGAVDIGGAWPGDHAEGVTYARHTVEITGGVIGLHSGLWGGEVQSGISGLQVSRLPPVSVEETTPLLTVVDRIHPNPGRSTHVIGLRVASGAGRTLEILDVAGRVVWRHTLDGLASGRREIVWDGHAADGRLAPAGVYFVRLPGVGLETPVKLVRID